MIFTCYKALLKNALCESGYGLGATKSCKTNIFKKDYLELKNLVAQITCFLLNVAKSKCLQS